MEIDQKSFGIKTIQSKFMANDLCLYVDKLKMGWYSIGDVVNDDIDERGEYSRIESCFFSMFNLIFWCKKKKIGFLFFSKNFK
jgi:hypothetical protein